MDRSETLTELAPAFARAQATMETAKKDAVNPFYKSNYADLGEVWRVVRTAFGPEGLSVIQLPETAEDGTVTLTTTLMHKSGEWLSGTMPVRLAKDDPQGVGSGITYARRYALAGLCGVVAEPDDDGEAAMGRGTGQAKAQAAPSAKPTPLPRPTKPPVDEITASIIKLQAELAKRHGITADALKEITKALRESITGGRASKLADLTGEEADNLSEALTQWAADQEAEPPDPDPFGDNSPEALAEGAQ